jgi:hypothetical protein
MDLGRPVGPKAGLGLPTQATGARIPPQYAEQGIH